MIWASLYGCTGCPLNYRFNNAASATFKAYSSSYYSYVFLKASLSFHNSMVSVPMVEKPPVTSVKTS